MKNKTIVSQKLFLTFPRITQEEKEKKINLAYNDKNIL